MEAKTGTVCYECQKEKLVRLIDGFPLCVDCIEELMC